MTAQLVAKTDVETALMRPLTATEDNYISGLIIQAEALLRTALPTVDDRIALYLSDPVDPKGIDPDAVRAMLAGVIKRYLVNVEGATSMSRTDGPFSETVAFASYGKSLAGGVSGSLVITAEDLKAIMRQGAPRLGSIRLKAALAPGRLEHDLRSGRR